MSIEKLIERFLNEVKLTKSTNTYKNYRTHMYKLLEFCKKENITDIRLWNGKETRGFRNFLLDKRLSVSSINAILSSLKSFFDFLIDEEIVKGNPVTAKMYLKKKEETVSFLTSDELKKLDNALEKIRKDVAFMFRLQLATGTRLSEVLNLTSKDIIEIDNSVFIKVLGKGNKERLIPVMDEFVAKELVRLRRKEGKLFDFSRSIVFYYSNKIKKLTGIDFHSHRLRHTTATKLLNNGVAIDVVQEVLGHASISTTRRYAKTSNEAVKRLAVKIR